jgi:hypothetical protein
VKLRGVAAGQYVIYYFLNGGFDKIGARANLTVR